MMTQEQLYSEIKRLKEERNAVILSHFYQTAEVQRGADLLGDSLQLSQEAGRTDAEVIVFCGVKFMAETASIISPEKRVLLPVRYAGCTLASAIKGSDLRAWKEQHPDGIVVSYVNTTADVKAETDYCVTSSNALDIVRKLPKDCPMLFCPDRNLGNYIRSKTGREMDIWDGCCVVHEVVNRIAVERFLTEYPDAELLIHPESPVARERDYQDNPRILFGSTAAILKRPAAFAEPHTFCIGTEIGIMTELERRYPQHTFVSMIPEKHCRTMKLISLEDVYESLLHDQYEVKVPDDVRERAIVPIRRMLEMSK